LYFVRNDEECANGKDIGGGGGGVEARKAHVVKVFVKRWSATLSVEAEDEAYAGVDWRATYKLNAATASVYEITIKQFQRKDRSDMTTTVRGRAYASPIWTELDDGGRPRANVEAYPTLVFSFDDAKEIRAERGDMAYATVHRARSVVPEIDLASMFDHVAADVVFGTHFALAVDAPSQRVGRALRECGDDASTSSPSFFRSPVRALRRFMSSSTPTKPFRRVGRPPDPGVEMYSAGDGVFVIRAVLAPAIDTAYDYIAAFAPAIDRSHH